MISPQEALAAIFGKARPLRPVRVPLEQGWSLRLAADVRASHPYPLFDNAALDGYALRSIDTVAAQARQPQYLTLCGSQMAGHQWTEIVPAGQALHVTAGAPIPRGADTLVPYEAASRGGRQIVLVRPAHAGKNIRRRGEDIKAGQILLCKGTRLQARQLALLAAVGVETVKVTPKPRVAVAVSGDELLRPGQALRPGCIFDSNTPALRALLKDAGIETATFRRLPDTVGAQTRALKKSLDACDVLIVVGGMSVGEKDLAKGVFQSLGIRQVFWRVAQKPGKPLYFGFRGQTLVFGLPGNPAAAISCFRAYGLPALQVLAGDPPAAPQSVRLAQGLPATGDKALMLKAQVQGEGSLARVTVLGGQGSHQLRSLAEGNALLLRPADSPALRKGQWVMVLPL